MWQLTYIPRLRHKLQLLHLQASIEERTKERRYSRALRNTDTLAVILVVDFDNVGCDVLMQECEDFGS